MTPAQGATLKHFAWHEWHHPALVDFGFAQFLDAVRTEYGFPLILTSDARTPTENAAASGGSPTSRHLLGQAVDLRFPPTANHLWLLVAAIFHCQRSQPIELELVHGPSDSHVHLAWHAMGRASSLEVAAT